MTLLYALIAGGPVAVGPFAALWLRGQGVAYGYVGVCIAAPLILRLPLYRPVAYLSSRFASNWSPVCLMCVMAGVASLVCVLCRGAGLALVAWCMLCVVANVCTPLMDHAILEGTPRDRGGGLLVKAKGAGAVAYLLAVPIIGYGLQWGGPLSLPLWSGAMACVAALSAWRIASRAVTRAGAWTAPPSPPLRVLQSQDETGDRYAVIMMLAAIILIEASHGVQPLAMVHWNQRGIPAEVTGILWATGTLADVALLWLASRWLNTIAPSILLVIGGIAAILRWIGFALEPALSAIFLLQALHALSFTLPCLAAVKLARELDGRADGQLLTWAASTGMAGGIAVLVAAPLYGVLGVQAYWIMTLLAGGGLSLALLVHFRLERSSLSQKVPSRLSFDKLLSP